MLTSLLSTTSEPVSVKSKRGRKRPVPTATEVRPEPTTPARAQDAMQGGATPTATTVGADPDSHSAIPLQACDPVDTPQVPSVTSHNTSCNITAPSPQPTVMDDSLHFFPYYMQTPSKQRILSKYGTPRRTSLDHCYSITPKPQTTQVRQRLLQSTPSEQESLHDMATDKEEDTFHNDPLNSSIESIEEHNDKDSDFIPSGTELLSDSCASDSESSDEKMEGLEQPKYLVFKDNLEMLFKFCQMCGAVVITKVPKTTGSMVSYTISCHEGHDYVWESQPTISQKPLGNALLSAAILTTGMC